MARPLRIEFPGGLYHVTSRGDRREAIYEDDDDRARFLEVLGDVAEGANWLCHAYCLMTNHYHLGIETPDGNLSKGMRQLNGVYTQYSNRRHGRVGHLFQGRYKAILVDRYAYLLELARYVVLNPVRAGMVEDPGQWPWSSFNAVMGQADHPAWLVTDGLLSQFGEERGVARRRYRRFVMEGLGAPSIWQGLNRQIYLGDDRFVEEMQARAEGGGEDVSIPLAQRRPPAPSLSAIATQYEDRDAAMAAAYGTGAYTYQAIAEHFGVHFTTVGRIVRGARKRAKEG
jgi:REP element-mobilizing transposase RayT